VGVGGLGNKRDFPDVISLYGWGLGDNGAEVFASIIHQNGGVRDGVGKARTNHGAPFRRFTWGNPPSSRLEGGDSGHSEDRGVTP
jgi:hypothetical protein